MPYAYELRNRQRVKRAAFATAVLIALLLLIFIAPTRMQGWAGLGLGNLFGTAEESTLELASAPPSVVTKRTPAGDHLSPPAPLEWTDVVAPGCVDCDGWEWSYDFEPPDAGHSWLTTLDESAEGLPSTSSLMANSSGNGGGGSRRGFGSNGGGAGGAGGSGGGGGAPSRPAGDTGSDSAADSTATEPQTATDGGTPEAARAARENSAEPSSSQASPASNQGARDSAAGAVEATGPAKPENLVLAPITAGQEGAGGPFASTDPSDQRAVSDDVVGAVANSQVGAETIYGEGDASRVAGLVALAPDTESSDGGSQRVTIVPEPASLTLLGMALAGAICRRRRTASS